MGGLPLKPKTTTASPYAPERPRRGSCLMNIEE